jgi:hypothetical protein
MSRSAKITAPFAGEEHEFRMAFGDIMRLQEKLDLGPYEVATRLHAGTWRVEDVREVIRIGLIGGGMEVPRAARMVKDFVEANPILESLALAQVIMQAGLVGAPDEPVGESAAAGTPNESTISQTAN